MVQCARCGNVVKRAMNRPPQEADCRGRQGKGPECKDTKCSFHMHQRFCGGVYTKVMHCEVTLSVISGLHASKLVMCQVALACLALSDSEVLTQTMRNELCTRYIYRYSFCKVSNKETWLECAMWQLTRLLYCTNIAA